MSPIPEDHPKTLGQLLAHARMQLRAADISNADLDARLLTLWATGCVLIDLVTKPDQVMTPEVDAQLSALIERRLKGEPVHRIMGEREFYGLKFALNKDTLEPRPDTEALINLVLPSLHECVAAHSVADILDMGTGTGAVAITLLHEVDGVRAVGVDIAAGALQMARINAQMAGVSARFATLQSDWFSTVTGRFDLIISNPPYIPHKIVLKLEREVRDYDPLIALDGGEDGLNFYRSLAQHAAHHLNMHGYVAVEIGIGQAQDVKAIFAGYGFNFIAGADDLAGHKRALLFQG